MPAPLACPTQQKRQSGINYRDGAEIYITLLGQILLFALTDRDNQSATSAASFFTFSYKSRQIDSF